MFVKKVVEHPMGILILYIVLLAFGAYTLKGLRVELTPDFSLPYINVSVSYDNAGTEEIESDINIPLENALSSLSGIKKISSIANPGYGVVALEFNWGINVNEKVNEIRDKIDTIRDLLPKDANSPQINKTDPSVIPLMQLSLNGSSGVEKLQEIGEDIISPMLKQVDGVGGISVFGGRKKIIRVEINQNRLEAYNLTMTGVASKLRGQNIEISGGTIKENAKNFLFKAKGKFETLEDVENAVVSYKPFIDKNGQTFLTIKLKDIANVYDSFEDAKTKLYTRNSKNKQNKKSVMIQVQKQSGKNIVSTARTLYPVIKKINKEILKDDDKLTILNDNSKIVVLSISNITKSALSGALYAILVIFLFLRNIKSSITIGLSIPMSIVITLIFMQLLNISINIMSLAGLALGIGMVVDSSVVILENIFQYRERGAKIQTSTVLGSTEMTRPIIASTLTTVAVFIPLVAFKDRIEMIGVFFTDLSMTVIISLLSSLVISLTLIPILSTKFLKVYTKTQRPIKIKFIKKIDDFFEKAFTKLERGYGFLIKIILKNRVLVIASMFIILILSFGSIFVVGFIFQPKSENGLIIINAELQEGTQVEETEKVMLDITLKLDKLFPKSYEILFAYSQYGEPSKASIYFKLKKIKDRKLSEEEIKTTIKKQIFEKYSIAKLEFGKFGPGGGGSSSPISIKLKSKNNKELIRVANEIKNYINYQMPELENATLNIENRNSQYVLKLNRERMYSLGLSTSQVTQEIRANIAGITAGKFSGFGKSRNITLYLDEKSKDSILNLDRIGVLNSSGKRIPISSFASFSQGLGSNKIIREGKIRTLTITADLTVSKNAEGKIVKTSLKEGNAKLKEFLKDKYSYNKEVSITVGGDMSDLLKYSKETVFLFLLAILLVYAILVLQFESLLDPFIIFSSIPLMFIGINLFYLITNIEYSMFTLVGALILSGVVVNNSIVFIDYVKLMVNRGMELNKACVLTGERRLRPILITSITTILGMLPLALGHQEGSNLIKPIAQAFSGGMISSTITTLLFIPALYSLVHTAKNKIKIKKENKRILKEKEIEKFLKDQKNETEKNDFDK